MSRILALSALAALSSVAATRRSPATVGTVALVESVALPRADTTASCGPAGERLRGAFPPIALELEADPYTLGGHQFDQPEHIRGLHARGDTVDSPVVLSVAGERRSFFLWGVDTRLDGEEAYDRFAVSLSPDVDRDPALLIELASGVPERIPVLERGKSAILLLPTIDRDLRGMSLCAVFGP